VTLTLDRVEVTLVCICGRGLPTHQIRWKSEKLFVDVRTGTPEFQSTRSSPRWWPKNWRKIYIACYHWTTKTSTIITKMWANAQRDGHPAKYRWCPLFNATKFGWRPLLECHTVTVPRCETRWNVLGCPKLANRSQLLVGRSSLYFEDMWGRHCCLTSFFPIVDTCFGCEDIARQSSAMVPRWWIFQTCILNSC